MKNTRLLLLLSACLGAAAPAQAQSVGIGTPTPNASAALDVSSTSQGLLLPCLTAAQRGSIVRPPLGLLVFQTDGSPGLYYFNGISWLNLTTGRVPDAAGTTPREVTTLAGMPTVAGSADGPGPTARFNSPYGVTVDADGTLYVADTNNNSIRKTTAAGVTTTLATGLGQPRNTALDAAGNLYVADRTNHVIRRITPAGVMSTFAGIVAGSGNLNGPANLSRFNSPVGVAVDAAGAVYVSDTGNNAVRKIVGGMVSTLATGLSTPTAIAVDAAGTLFVAETFTHVVRTITPAGVVTVLAGAVGVAGSADGPVATARLNSPNGVAAGPVGTVYVADTGNSIIRQISGGVVSTLAGLAGVGASVDGSAANARFSSPFGVAVDATGTLYVADTGNNTIRVIR